MVSCALFPKSNKYIQGVESYQKNEYQKAIQYFTDFYRQSPAGDSTLFYLYNCYCKIGDTETGIAILQELANRKNPREQIYTNLFSYYRQQGLYHKVNRLLMSMPFPVAQQFTRRYYLTQRLCAEIITGAVANNPVKDPIAYTIEKKFLRPSPDGKFYENDTIKLCHLIILLDNFLPPDKPEHTYVSKHIRADSYLFLPYSRLVSKGILSPDENTNPEMNASLLLAVKAINALKEKGFLK